MVLVKVNFAGKSAALALLRRQFVNFQLFVKSEVRALESMWED